VVEELFMDPVPCFPRDHPNHHLEAVLRPDLGGHVRHKVVILVRISEPGEDRIQRVQHLVDLGDAMAV
jgi:hypothetical protein